MDWKTRLVVSYVDGADTVEISPIDSFTPSFSLNAEVLHSIQQTHIGVIYSPDSVTFTLTVKAIGDVAAKLTKLALDKKRFDLVLKEKTGADWAFQSVVLRDCQITSASPSAATISGAPAATFSGFSLAGSMEDNYSGKASVPA